MSKHDTATLDLFPLSAMPAAYRGDPAPKPKPPKVTDKKAWAEAAYTAFVAYAGRNIVFVTEDVSANHPDLTPPEPRWWGQVAQRAQRKGIVRAIDRYAPRGSRGRTSVIWEKAA